MSGLHRTIWYELQARDWPFKNQAAEALIWQIGSGEGMKRVLASVSLGKEVTVSSHLFVRGEGRRARGQGVGTGQGCTLFPFLFLWGSICFFVGVHLFHSISYSKALHSFVGFTFGPFFFLGSFRFFL